MAWPVLTPGHLIDLLLPDLCRVCGGDTRSAGYCDACAAGLLRHGRQCRACGVPVVIDGLCGRCQRRPAPIAETVAPFRYAPPVSEDIHKLKYHRKLACGRDLGTLLARELEARLPELPEVLVPVPLHWRRQFQRGFNQSVEIARPVSRILGVPIETGLVKRTAYTPPQVGLGPATRRRNLRRAFKTTGATMPASVAIVDDVITSGATVAEVARCLRRAGVETVFVWALVRA
ncbi:MAG: ComF family protein [Gammaproteobacteria bacterium]|nr:ComF family protein [Gammaproteobacteria bacterium]